MYDIKAYTYYSKTYPSDMTLSKFQRKGAVPKGIRKQNICIIAIVLFAVYTYRNTSKICTPFWECGMCIVRM